MSSIERGIEVDVPIRSAYNRWTQFEPFPPFMEGVHEVRQIEDKRLLWRAEIGGKSGEIHEHGGPTPSSGVGKDISGAMGGSLSDSQSKLVGPTDTEQDIDTGASDQDLCRPHR